MRYTYLPFDRRPDDKWSDTHGQLAQPDIGAFGSNGIIGRRCDTHPPADTFSLDPQNDEFGAFPHGIDQMGKATEELQPLFGSFDPQQLVKRGAGAKGLVPARAEDDHPRVAVVACAMDLMGDRLEQTARQGIALGVMEFNGRYPVVLFGSYISFLDLLIHSDSVCEV